MLSGCPWLGEWVFAGAHTGKGVRWRGRLLGPGGAVAELRTPWPYVYVFDVFWLLSYGL